jgi:2,3-bisphosphoglycerate-independent phosphoglycerate mutase
MSLRVKPLVLLILDGFGYTETEENNAIAMANTPCWDTLQQRYPMTYLNCSGHAVGLPEGQMGNSEVGHLHIGSGRYVPQDFSKVNDAIIEGRFFENPVLCHAIDEAKANENSLHILGLLSPGGVHSHETHIAAMLELAANRGLSNVYLHAFLDGRDVPPQSAAHSLIWIEDKMTALGVGKIVSMTGRFYAMDRDNRWDRIHQAYDMLMKAKAPYLATNAQEGLAAAYARGETDEFVMPTLIAPTADEAIFIGLDDAVVFMNFRADRAREISQAITETDFDQFERNHPPHRGYFATLTEYHEKFTYPIAFPSLEIRNSLGEYLAHLGLTQLRLAETEKYAHVTFFFNGGRDTPFDGEDRILVPSPKVKTYDLQPEMSAPEVTYHLVKAIQEGHHDVIICNFANCDMVGHTGVLSAAIQAVETIDASVQCIVDALKSVGGRMLITADHGNIEKMRDDKSGQPHTAHTTNLVPLVYVEGEGALASGGNLADIAPTMLAILGLALPAEMSGKSLLVTH